VSLLSELGGIFSIPLSFIGMIGKYVNTQLFMAEMMSEL